MLLKITIKVLLDRNTMCSSIVHLIHDYCCCSLLLLLFIVYRSTVTVILYCYCIVSVFKVTLILIVLTELNNNINGQLIVRLAKVIEETTSVFRVNLGYRLCN